MNRVACGGTLYYPLAAAPMGAPVLGPDPILTSNDITAAPAGYTLFDWVPNFAVRYGVTVNSTLPGDWNTPGTWSTGAVPTSTDNVVIQTAVTWKAGYTINCNILVIADGGSLTAVASGSDSLTMSVLTLQVLPKFSQTAGPFLNNHRYSLPDANGGGLLQIGTPASPIPATATVTVTFKDSAFSTASAGGDGTSHGEAKDPQQYGHGLIVHGQFIVCGAARTNMVRVTAEPLANATTISLASVPTGWLDGDSLHLPDTRQPRADNSTITGLAAGSFTQFDNFQANGAVSSTTLSVKGGAGAGGGIQYDHLGGYDATNTLDTTCLPHVVNKTRNVVFQNQGAPSAATTPPHAYFTDFAYIDIQNSKWTGFGRTNCNELDDTTYSQNPNPALSAPSNYGTVTHYGGGSPQTLNLAGNIDARRGPNFFNLVGRANQRINIGGTNYICRFDGNVVTNWSTGPFMTNPLWGTALGTMGLTVRQTSDGHFCNNVVHSDPTASRANGASIFLDGTGEFDNLFDSNFCGGNDGNNSRGDITTPGGPTNQRPIAGPGTQGDTYYIAWPGSTFTNNVATNNILGTNAVVHGFNMWLVKAGSTFVDAVVNAYGRPHFAGEDPQNWITTSPINGEAGYNPRQIPWSLWSGNEAYGCCGPFTSWWIGTQPVGHTNSFPTVGPSTFSNAKCWCYFADGWFSYESWHVTWDGFKTRGQKFWTTTTDPAQFSWQPNDYIQGGATLKNCDFQGANVAIVPPAVTDTQDATFTVQNCTVSCAPLILNGPAYNIFIGTPCSVNQGGPDTPIATTISGITIAAGSSDSHQVTMGFGNAYNNTSRANILVSMTVTVLPGDGHTYAVYDNMQDGNANQDGNGFVWQSGTNNGSIFFDTAAPTGGTHYTNTSLLAFNGKSTYNHITPGGTVTKPWLAGGTAIQTA